MDTHAIINTQVIILRTTKLWTKGWNKNSVLNFAAQDNQKPRYLALHGAQILTWFAIGTA